MCARPLRRPPTRATARPASLLSLGGLLLTLSVVGATGGCGSSTLVKRTIVFQPQQQVNRGRPFYALVRTVEEQGFLTDSYQKISALVYPSDKKDQTIVHVALIWPSREKTVVVKVPKDKAVAIYCLFTRPGSQWKVLLPPPMAEKIWAVLDRGTIVAQTEQERKQERKKRKDDRADKVGAGAKAR